MTVLKVKDKEYRLKFGYRSFKKSGVLREVVDMQKKVKGQNEKKDNSEEEAAANVEMLEEILELNSKLVLAALQKNHEEFRTDYENLESVSVNLEKVDDLIDDYMDEENSVSIMELFNKLVDELFNDGFLSKKSEKLEVSMIETDATVAPTDHVRAVN